MKLSGSKGKGSYQRILKASVYLFLAVMFWTSQSLGVVDLVKVPSLDMISEAEADSRLENASLSACKQYCFSDSIPKHLVIPGTQDPAANISWYAGSQVKIKISRGTFPFVIGMDKSDAKTVLQEENLTYVTINGRNDTVQQGFIFDQEPKKAGCYLPKELRIFVNAPLSVGNIIVNPSERNDSEILVKSSTIIVEGRLSSSLREFEHLWIALKPDYSINNWWPQTPPGDIKPDHDGTFQGNAYIGGNNGNRFEIGILILDNETNRRFLDWEDYSRAINSWAPITDPALTMNVTKADIEAKKIAYLNVTLNVLKNNNNESSVR